MVRDKVLLTEFMIRLKLDFNYSIKITDRGLNKKGRVYEIKNSLGIRVFLIPSEREIWIMTSSWEEAMILKGLLGDRG